MTQVTFQYDFRHLILKAQKANLPASFVQDELALYHTHPKIVYGVTITTDERSSRELKCLFVNKSDAEAVSVKAGWYGSDGTVWSRPLHSSIDEYNGTAKATLRKNALAKLSDEEKAALGL